jgi:hypothetical protein
MQIRARADLIIAITLFVYASLLSPCHAADIVLVRGGEPKSLENGQIQMIADFYGVNLKAIEVSPSALGQLTESLQSPETVAVLVQANIPQRVDGKQILAALRHRKGKPIPAMLFGITQGTDSNELKAWSNGTVDACIGLEQNFNPTQLTVAGPANLTRQLQGIELPVITSPSCRLTWADSETAVSTVIAASDPNAVTAPLLIRIHDHSQEVFFIPRERSLDRNWTPTGAPDSFSSVSPFIVVLSNAIGDFGWHLNDHYANLTIDDPWLIQPYGSLDYEALTLEMEKHRFHTTIAFVPWNFDRSRSEIVALFKAHPDLYSISIHGNNHAHREFGDYKINGLARQIGDIRQGIARMERFMALTHLPYDRFMVFPHSVAPEPTFAALRAYGFLGTANSSNVPYGEPFPRDPMFYLRPFTTRYGNLLSLRRYSALGDVPRVVVAIQTFLGNPILFYDHSSLFNASIAAFDAHADFVNLIQPDTKWTSLGEIARHCYLMRKRNGGGTDVLMLSSEMALENTSSTEKLYYVRRAARSGPRGILTVDGAPMDSTASEQRIVVPAHRSRVVRMIYDDALSPGHDETEKRSTYVYALRIASDIRDMYIAKSSFGRSFVAYYYRYRLDSAELFMERNWWAVLVAILFGYGIVRYHERRTGVSASARGSKAI